MENSSYIENCFFIKNKKKFFGYKKLMTIREVVNLLENKKISIYNFDFDEDENFDKEKFLDLKIDSYDCFQLGIEGESSRGFELFYDNKNKNYIIRLLTPSSKEDWLFAIDYAKILAQKMKTDIIYENRDIYSIETISNFDYRDDTLKSLKEIKNILNESDNQPRTIMFNGIHRAIILNKKICDDILSAIDPVKAFDRFVKELQYIKDALILKQQILSFTNEETKEITRILGMYTLTENIKSVLPYLEIPIIEDTKLLNEELLEKIEWGIFLALFDEQNKRDLSMRVKYSDFVNNLPKDKYKKLDGGYMILDGLTRKEMIDIYNKSEKLNLFGT